MGIESGDRRSKATRIVLVALVAALVLGLSPTVRDRLGLTLPFGLEQRFRGEYEGTMSFEPLPGEPVGQPLYERDDPWRAWLADEAACPGGENRSAAPADQVQTMLCLVNFARQHQRLRPLVFSPLLNVSAAAKADDIVRCGVFAHEACGKPTDGAARNLGYAGSFGENLYMADGTLVVPRVALDKWLASDGHRRNLFRPQWRTIGIALRPEADVEAIRDGVVWVNQFGD